VGERFQRGLNYAIVDEVDSILIDEARTPLIISGQAEDSTELYARSIRSSRAGEAGERRGAGRLLGRLEAAHRDPLRAGSRARRGDHARAGLLPEGASLYDPTNIMLMHHLYAGIRAHALYHRDQHYVVQTTRS